MRGRHLAYVAVAVAVLLVLWKVLGGSAEDRIRSALEEMAEIAQKEPNEADVVGLGKARRLGEFFVEDAQAADSLEGGVAQGRSSIVQAIAWARASESSATYAIEDLEFSLLGPEQAACRFRVRVGAPRSSELDGTRVTLDWARVDGDWLIASAFVERPREAPAGP